MENKSNMKIKVKNNKQMFEYSDYFLPEVVEYFSYTQDKYLLKDLMKFEKEQHESTYDWLGRYVENLRFRQKDVMKHLKAYPGVSSKSFMIRKMLHQKNLLTQSINRVENFLQPS